MYINTYKILSYECYLKRCAAVTPISQCKGKTDARDFLFFVNNPIVL